MSLRTPSPYSKTLEIDDRPRHRTRHPQPCTPRPHLPCLPPLSACHRCSSCSPFGCGQHALPNETGAQPGDHGSWHLNKCTQLHTTFASRSPSTSRVRELRVCCGGLRRIRCHAAISAPCARVECMRQGAQAGGVRAAGRRVVLSARPSGPAPVQLDAGRRSLAAKSPVTRSTTGRGRGQAERCRAG